MIFTDQQERAIKAIIAWYTDPSANQIFYLAGYAGVGKTTIVREAIDRLKETGHGGYLNVKTAAYTGKAAAVLKKKGVVASTIHSLIYEPVDDPKTGGVIFILDLDGPAAEADLIVLDECSMISKELAADLLSFGKKILVMGDPGQLPPVKGEGWLQSHPPDIFLDEVHRQAKDSPIIELATLARQGKRLPLGYKKGDVQVVQMAGKSERELIYNPDTQVLVGKSKTRFETTRRIRKRLGFLGQDPEVGERVMCCQNNKTRGIFNGQLGNLLAIEKQHSSSGHKFWYELRVKLDDMEHEVDQLDTDPVEFQKHFTEGKAEWIGWRLNRFDWAYSITVHKAQGSQWPHVTLVDDSSSFRENAKEWLYTGLTRAETGLTVLVR